MNKNWEEGTRKIGPMLLKGGLLGKKRRGNLRKPPRDGPDREGKSCKPKNFAMQINSAVYGNVYFKDGGSWEMS